MFASAIDKVACFTRPIHTISRQYQSGTVFPGTATLFFVNPNGYAITCKHVVQIIGQAEQINAQYRRFQHERAQLAHNGVTHPESLAQLEKNYQYNAGVTVQMLNTFVDCVDQVTKLEFHVHPTLDLAIIRFHGYNQILYKNYAVFEKNPQNIRQGDFLCRLGFPFPEFTNYEYNATKDEIHWTNAKAITPRFPMEGMVTRFLADQHQMYGIELSTPGLRGQSGGPLFNAEGKVCGMQFSTKHMHLGFDIVNKEMFINNSLQRISDYSFMHLGQCIHVDSIKAFLTQHGVEFYEE